MNANTPQEQKDFIVELLAELNGLIFKTGISIWDKPQFRSVDAWESKFDRTKNDDLSISIQFTTSLLRQFHAGLSAVIIDKNLKSEQAEKILIFGPDIVKQSVSIRLEILSFLHITGDNLEQELWLYELMNNLQDLSGLIQHKLHQAVSINFI